MSKNDSGVAEVERTPRGSHPQVERLTQAAAAFSEEQKCSRRSCRTTSGIL